MEDKKDSVKIVVEEDKTPKKEVNDTSDAVTWGFVIGFALFFVLLILIICFTN